MAQGFDFFAGGVCLLDFGYFFGGGFVGFAVFALGLVFFGGGDGFFDGVVVVFGDDDFCRCSRRGRRCNFRYSCI